MGCKNSKHGVGTSAVQISPSKKKRFCTCEAPDGTDSFICTNCSLIKKRARDKATSMKTKGKMGLLKVTEQEPNSKVEEEKAGNGDDKPSAASEEERNDSVLRHVKKVINYKTFLEKAFEKVFSDFDVDGHNYIGATEFRQMSLEYEDGTEIYQPVSEEEAETFITAIDDTGDAILDSCQFKKKMTMFFRMNVNKLTDLVGGGHENRLIVMKVFQFVKNVRKRLDRRAAFLYQLFTDYSQPKYVAERSEWVKDVLGTDEVYSMMCDIVQNDRKKPSEENVLEFMRSVDKSGDLFLSQGEFIEYMLGRLTDSQNKLRQFMKESRCNNRVAFFLRSVDNHVKSMDAMMTLDDVNMELVMREIQDALHQEAAERERRASPVNVNSSRDSDMFSGNGATDTSPDRFQSPKGPQDGSPSRMMHIFKPKVLQRAAEHTTDMMTRSSLLNIINEELRTNGLTRTPEQSMALQDLLVASENGIGKRRVRLSGSERNLTRVKTEFREDQKRIENERRAIRSKQQAKTREKLQKRKTLRQKKFSMKLKIKTLTAFALPPLKPKGSNHVLTVVPQQQSFEPIENPNEGSSPVIEIAKDFRVVF